MTQATIGKWGKSLGVRLPAEAARALGLEAGSAVEIVAGEGELVVRPVVTPVKSLRDLFRDKSASEWRDLYAGSGVDWGPDRGREIIDE